MTNNQKIGFRVLERPSPELGQTTIDAFATVGTAQVSDCMGRLYGSVGLRPFHHAQQRLAGIALTVKARPGDNLMIHKALTLARPGDVLVVDGGGDLRQALVGELMRARAISRGVAGFVVDGAIRDVDSFAVGDFPCFARGVSHLGPYKDGPGEIHVPVSIGGQVVRSGDLVLGDTDGLVFVPADMADAVLPLALAKARAEAASLLRIQAEGAGEKLWIDRTIAERAGQAG